MNNNTSTMIDPIVSKEVRIVRSLGMHVSSEETINNDNCVVSVIINDKYTKGKVLSPISIGMSTNDLIDIVAKVKSLGWCGKRVIKSMVDAINELNDDDRNALHTRCFIRQYNSISIVRYFIELLLNMIEVQGVVINRHHLTINTVRNLWWSFGGYKGLKKLFTDCLLETVGELRRIKQLEDKLNNDKTLANITKSIAIAWYWDKFKDLSLKPIKHEKSQCTTCSHCKIKNGYRYCKRGYINIPKDMTVEEINRLYPSVFMINGKTLCSQHIMLPQTNCEMYKSRIGYGAESKRVEPSTESIDINDDSFIIQYTMLHE